MLVSGPTITTLCCFIFSLSNMREYTSMIAKELTSIQTKCYQYAKGQCIMRAIQCISRSRRLPEHGWLIKPGTEFHCLRYIHWLKKLRIELNKLASIKWTKLTFIQPSIPQAQLSTLTTVIFDYVCRLSCKCWHLVLIFIVNKPLI